MNETRASVEADGESYRLPPAAIARIVTAEPPPAMSLSPGRRAFALLGRPSLPPISDLARPDLRLAGVRIDPVTHGPAAPGFFDTMVLGEIGAAPRRDVAGMPDPARMSEVRWSPDGSRIAFVNTTDEALELWLVDVAAASARLLLDQPLNATLGTPYQWEPSSRALLVKLVPSEREAPPEKSRIPTGPLVQESLGKTAPARTYQDLLKTPHDAQLFAHHCASALARIDVDGGDPKVLRDPGIFTDFTPSPSGEYILLEEIKRPFSYLVPFYRFPTEVTILDAAGVAVRQVADLPLAEDVPVAFDSVTTGPRSIQWRADAPHALAWVEALDGGDPRVPAEFRDQLFLLPSPEGEARPLIALEHRYAGIVWGRGDFAMLYTRWWTSRTERRYQVEPGNVHSTPRLLEERSYEDRYGDPGRPVTVRNAAGRFVLIFTPNGSEIFLAGDGASEQGDYPFLDRMNVETGERTRVWRAENPYYEEVAAVLNAEGTRLLTRRESSLEAPNYVLRDLSAGTSQPITSFPDPAPELAGIGREIVSYVRPDGVKLSATLFTPPGYDSERDGPLPMLMWAYPREFKDADAAGQIDDSPNRFSRPAGASHLFLLAEGYAILDGPAMPIVAEKEGEPNDSYIEQLVTNARAAVDHVVEMGVADRGRMAVGGHSYGAFMTANLLAHSDLFRAGIARSGAYNRTLTPFGFQQEQRTYWEAPEIYHRMSPFTFAHRISAPILLIHGEVDNNSGTFPLQTERLYHALKGHGATVRYVVLPHESHGYRARESILHVLSETIDWLDRYVKGAEGEGNAS